jgi:hypothetical protein
VHACYPHTPPGKQRLPDEHVLELHTQAPLVVLQLPPPPALHTASEPQRHTYCEQLKPDGQLRPQAPQFCGSVLRFLQPGGV